MCVRAQVYTEQFYLLLGCSNRRYLGTDSGSSELTKKNRNYPLPQMTTPWIQGWENVF